ncbi:helix-turn-helix domain-containing protein [Shewanella sp. 10N.286.48.B5]|uniref:helix-turn-helix domain-containing protein n=1 Tax=Shewanella sp. 10N.286.48.B5 TaxID=1880834 RepID=UPI000C82F652|nr:AraC family transcriptional regulator [Shewanella sp. 10N.286.48.B5]PMH89134.1 AraC family transcriptional regulator [Shewanella sp. 10N.286.48.B5]
MRRSTFSTNVYCEPIAIQAGYQFEVHQVSYQAEDAYSCFTHFHQVHEFIIFEDVEGTYFHSQGQAAIQPHDVIFTPALETHDYELTDHAKSWHIIQFLPQFLIDNELHHEEAMLRHGLHLRLKAKEWQDVKLQVSWLLESYAADPHSIKSATLLKLIVIWLVAHGEPVSHDAKKSLIISQNYQRLMPILNLFRQQELVDLTLVEAAALCHISTSYFSRMFKRTFKCNYSQYLVQHKLYSGARILGQTNRSVTEISYDLNFSNPSHFIALFKKHFGITPKQYRSQMQRTKLTGI